LNIAKKQSALFYLRIITWLFVLSSFIVPKDSFGLRYQDKDNGHDFILVGVGVARFNLVGTQADPVVFNRNDQGLPGEYSNRNRFSLYGEGVVFHDYEFRLKAHYDEEDPYEDARFLLEVKKDDHYLIAGDHEKDIFTDTVFTALDKRIRGLTLHGQVEKGSLTAMAGAVRGESAIDEILADGTSGPYRLEEIPVVEGSEQVRIESRDRTNSNRVIQSVTQSRGKDYYIDYDNGEITFNRPIEREDFRGNPTFIVVTYQFDTLGERFSRMVWGSRATVTPVEGVRIGATYLGDGPFDGNLSEDIFDETVDKRRQIYGSDLSLQLSDRYRIGMEAAQSEIPELEDPLTDNAVRVNFDANPFDPLRVYGRYWKVGRDFLTFGNSDLSSSRVFDDIQHEDPFEFRSASLRFDLDPNISTNLGTDEESLGASAAYLFGDFNTISAGARQSHDNIPEDPELPVNTIEEAFVSLKRIHPDQADYLLGAERIHTFDDQNPKTLDTQSFRILGGVRHLLGNYRYTGDVIVQGAYQYEKFDDIIADENDRQAHDIIGRAEFLPYRDLLVFVEQAEQFLYEDFAAEFIRRTDTSMLGIEGLVNRYFDIQLLAKYRTVTDLVEEQTEEVEQVYSLLWVSSPFDTLKTRLRIEYRNVDFKLAGRTDEKIVLGGQVFWNIFSNLLATVKYSREIDTSDSVEATDERFTYDDLILRLDYKVHDKWSLFAYYRLENDEVETEPLDPTLAQATTILLGAKCYLTERIEMTASYKEKSLEGDIDNKQYKYFGELGYRLTDYFTIALGYEHYRFSGNLEGEDGENDAYSSDSVYLNLIAKF
jgi:hypothetical protein